MIHEVKGDILLSHAQVIAHGLAPYDPFEHGLALNLGRQWPGLIKDFHHFCHTMDPKGGEVWVWPGAMGKRVINLLTNEPSETLKDKPVSVRIEYVDRALRELRHLLETEKFSHVALPRLATGAGGLDWTEVQPLIVYHLGGLDLPIYIYTGYEKGVQAMEPGLSDVSRTRR